MSGLRAAKTDYGVGFRVIPAINRRDGGTAARELVELVVANPMPEVVGIGMDDLTIEGLEDPRQFADAYALARRHGLRNLSTCGRDSEGHPG